MYNPKTNQIILEIPKCGSRSLVQASIEQHGKRYVKHPGHKTLAEVLALASPKIGEKDVEVIAVLRCPEQRFVSQVANFMAIKNKKLDAALRACAEQSHIIFKSQHEFLDVPEEWEAWVNVLMYPMELHDRAQARIAGRPVTHNANKTEAKPYTMEVLRQQEGFDAAFAHFTDDYVLHDAALTLNGL